ncbi:YfaZ precursor [Marinomonas spartinae]|uniref:YfaZ n=1 Tax=Marinomonas spartinae TaxID=1792290 RepID=A0A1A8TJH3_9GAMM|nr:YfaZ family outer membrane protein [Marinomonas spartinae]SBS33926.1 YfaZ precursor [Marinomonas spartinae]SBS37977.1 YfaZ precursor [Marinomonas spartinae]
MKLSNKALLLTAGLLSSSMVLASNVGVNLRNDLLKADASIDAGPFSIDAGGTHDADKDTSSAYAGLSIQDTDATGPLQVGLGARLYALDSNLKDENNDLALAVALGGWYRYTFPMANRLSIYASGYYSPEVLTISRLDHMYTYNARLEYMTTHNTRAFISYGATEAIYKNGERQRSNDGISVGANVVF